MTACGGDSGKSEEHIDAKEKFGCNVLNVYNAGEYIGEDVISTFEKSIMRVLTMIHLNLMKLCILNY